MLVQVEGYTAHLRPPHLRYDLPARIGNCDSERHSVFLPFSCQGQVVEVVVLVSLLLPASRVEVLSEVALPVE